MSEPLSQPSPAPSTLENLKIAKKLQNPWRFGYMLTVPAEEIDAAINALDLFPSEDEERVTVPEVHDLANVVVYALDFLPGREGMDGVHAHAKESLDALVKLAARPLSLTVSRPAEPDPKSWDHPAGYVPAQWIADLLDGINEDGYDTNRAAFEYLRNGLYVLLAGAGKSKESTPPSVEHPQTLEHEGATFSRRPGMAPLEGDLIAFPNGLRVWVSEIDTEAANGYFAAANDAGAALYRPLPEETVEPAPLAVIECEGESWSRNDFATEGKNMTLSVQVPADKKWKVRLEAIVAGTSDNEVGA